MEMEEGERRFFKHLKSIEVEETKKEGSQCICDEDGTLLQDKNLISLRWVRLFYLSIARSAIITSPAVGSIPTSGSVTYCRSLEVMPGSSLSY